jgi:hypothetical protein
MKLTAEQIRNYIREGNEIEAIKDGAHIIILSDKEHASSSIAGRGKDIVNLLLNIMMEDPDFALLLKGTVMEYEKIRRFQESSQKAVGHMDNIIESLDKLANIIQEIHGDKKPNNNRKPRRNGKQHKS